MTTMDEDKRAAVSRAALFLEVQRRAVEIAQDDLTFAVRAAVYHGVPATEVAKLAGISRARVYQIRDGKR